MFATNDQICMKSMQRCPETGMAPHPSPPGDLHKTTRGTEAAVTGRRCSRRDRWVVEILLSECET